MSDRPMDDEFVLPCGCRTGTVEDTFVIVACPAGEDCKWVKYAQGVAAESGKPSTVLEVP